LNAIEAASQLVWFLGDTVQALETVVAALEKHPLDSLEPLDRQYPGLAGFYALAGAPERAREMMVEWETVVPLELRGREDVTRHRLWAMVAAAEGRPEEALAELRYAHERSGCPTCQLPLLGSVCESLVPRDSALDAYEQYLTIPYHARMLEIDSPAAGGGSFLLPVIYERLGALHEQRGDTAKRGPLLRQAG
jgi:hypothetical protein